MKANNSNLNVVTWECYESLLKVVPDIFTTIQAKGADIASDKNAQALKITWTCKASYSGKKVLLYISEDAYRVPNSKEFTIEMFGNTLANSFERVNEEFKFRTKHIGDFNLSFSMPNAQVEEYYMKLEYGQ